MRAPSLLVAVALLTLSLPASADETMTTVDFSRSTEPTTAVTGAPMSLASMGFGLEYERSLASMLSLFASVEGSLMWKGYGGQAGARLYPGGTPLRGLFLDAHAAAFRGRVGAEPYLQWGGGMLVGHSWVVGEGLLVSVGGGAEVRQVDVAPGSTGPSCLSVVCYTDVLGEQEGEINGVRLAPAVRAAIGYVF